MKYNAQLCKVKMFINICLYIEKYVDEMRHIQGVLNDMNKKQKSERCAFFKKYR